MKEFDLFVIGAGSGGVRASRLAAALGKTVAVAEQEYLGGTCVNVGCVPKKLFYYGSHLRDDIALADGFGWDLKAEGFSWQRLRDNKDREIERLNQIYKDLLENSGVVLLEGGATFIDNQTVTVNGTSYRAKNILIASGSSPYVPDFPGCEHVITSRDVFYLESLPDKITVVGGGYIAVEFAGIFNGLGVETELVYRGDLFLRGFDNEVREVVAEEMVKKGVSIRFNTTINRIEPLDGMHKKVTESDGSERVVREVLYATGRRPYTDHLCLENTAVKLAENGAITVSDCFQTNVPSIYAIGDVIDRIQLTPVALCEADVLINHLFGDGSKLMDYDVIPTAVFSNPNIGTVGLSEEESKAQFKNVDVYRSRFSPMKHSLSGGHEKTFMKMVVDRDTDKVLGLHMVGDDAGEIVQGMAVAIKAGATKSIFDSTIGIHPTAAEEFVTMRKPS
ncbi:MAG: glutathione-disulfide reductase [Gammaproteobacteria bacterium]|nr:glutathione-disulfide reductase [Gammaproteobacteria bacterium]